MASTGISSGSMPDYPDRLFAQEDILLDKLKGTDSQFTAEKAKNKTIKPGLKIVKKGIMASIFGGTVQISPEGKKNVENVTIGIDSLRYFLNRHKDQLKPVTTNSADYSKADFSKLDEQQLKAAFYQYLKAPGRLQILQSMRLMKEAPKTAVAQTHQALRRETTTETAAVSSSPTVTNQSSAKTGATTAKKTETLPVVRGLNAELTQRLQQKNQTQNIPTTATPPRRKPPLPPQKPMGDSLQTARKAVDIVSKRFAGNNTSPTTPIATPPTTAKKNPTPQATAPQKKAVAQTTPKTLADHIKEGMILYIPPGKKKRT